MKSARRGASWIAPLVCAIGGLLLVYSITQPPARTGTGSTISLHELFDLLLAGNLPLGIPRWLGLFGYVPAIGGALVLLAEALPVRSRSLVRTIGCVVAAVTVVVLISQGPWQSNGGPGPALWLGVAGVIVVVVGMVLDSMFGRRGLRRRPGGSGSVQQHVAAPDESFEPEGEDDDLFRVWR